MIQARRRGPRHEATVARIVECLVPAFPALQPETRASVLNDVTRFVSSQIGALPDFLRAPYLLALTAFEWLPLLRWGLPFRALDAERRAACVWFWNDSDLSPLRNFLRLIRGCALLAYFDHPTVVAALPSLRLERTAIRSSASSAGG